MDGASRRTTPRHVSCTKNQPQKVMVTRCPILASFTVKGSACRQTIAKLVNGQKNLRPSATLLASMNWVSSTNEGMAFRRTLPKREICIKRLRQAEMVTV